jgi:hypothetical protein
VIAPFEPATYPGPRAPGPTVVHQGRAHRVELDAGDEHPDVPVAPPVEAEVFAPGALRWVVAYGSNASPGRLLDKGLDERGAVLLPAVLAGWVPAFEDRATGYGSIPLTLVPDAGARIDTWVLGLHADDVPALDRSEGRLTSDAVGATWADDLRHAPSGAYRLGHVGEVTVADRWRLPDALAYLPGPRTRVQITPDGGWRTWPASDQATAATHVASGGPSRPPPPVPRPITGGWPRTPLLEVPSPSR